jgi:hypothetical protein
VRFHYNRFLFNSDFEDLKCNNNTKFLIEKLNVFKKYWDF